MIKYTLHLDFLKKWRWHLETAEGKRIATGEAHESREECEAAITLNRTSGAAPLEEKAADGSDGK